MLQTFVEITPVADEVHDGGSNSRMPLKNRPKRFFLGGLLLLAVATIGVIVCYRILNPESVDAEPGSGIYASSEPDRESMRKEEILSRALERRIRFAPAGSSEPTEEEELPINIREDSEEDKTKAWERTKRTNPYYWKLAPEVFEEMLEGQTADPYWTASTESEAKRFLAREEFEGCPIPRKSPGRIPRRFPGRSGGTGLAAVSHDIPRAYR